MAILFSARTDVGRVREQNEDNFLVDRKLQLYVVCDGMGGHLGGEVASATAVNVVRETLLQHRDIVDAYRLHDGMVDEEDVQALLTQAVQDASNRIYERGQRNAEQRGMGTTLSLLMLLGARAFVAHVGDSRIYRWRRGQVEQLTEDHSFYNAMKASGADMRRAEIAGQFKNAVTRAVGVAASVEVDTAALPLEAGDRFLLCSDGLHGYMDDDDATRFLADDDLHRAAEAMIQFANGRGGRDNITAVVVQIPPDGLGEEAEARIEDLEARVRLSILGHGLTDGEVAALARRMELVEHAPGAPVFSVGTPADALLLLVEGELVGESAAGGHRRFRPGDLLGEAGFFTSGSHSIRVRAADEEPSRCLRLTRAAAERLLGDEPALLARLLLKLGRQVAGRLEGAAEAAEEPLWSYGSPDRPSPPTRRRGLRVRSPTVDLDAAEIMEATGVDVSQVTVVASAAPPPVPAVPPPLDDEPDVGEGTADTLPGLADVGPPREVALADTDPSVPAMADDEDEGDLWPAAEDEGGEDLAPGEDDEDTPPGGLVVLAVAGEDAPPPLPTRPEAPPEEGP